MNKLLMNELTCEFKQTSSNEYENEYCILRLNEDGSVTRIFKESQRKYTFDKIKIYKRLDNIKSKMKRYYLNDINKSECVTKYYGVEYDKDYTNIENWELVEIIEL